MSMLLDRDTHTAPAALLADSDYDGFRPDTRDEDDGVFAEITERRAQLENADILRGARAL